MANKQFEQTIQTKVTTLTPVELRLVAGFAQDELDKRRSSWVQTMCDRFADKEDRNMAVATRVHSPNTDWEVDRVIVNCFIDESRSKVVTGISRVHPKDYFDHFVGVAIAFARAMGEPVPDLF